MPTLVDTTMFDSDAEVLMVLYNAATTGRCSLEVPMSIEDAQMEVYSTPILITFINSKMLMLHFDGTSTLDCSQYDTANGEPGYGRRVLGEYLLQKVQQSVA